MADLHNQDDMPFEEPIVELNAPDGSVYRFRYGAVIPYAGEEYVVLLEMEKNADGEEQVLITRMVEEGDPKATLVWNTMIYQCCKQIGAMSTVLEGKVDGILLTGGLVRYADIVEGISRRCGWIAPISVYPGEMEQQAMAYSVLKVLHGEKEAIHYSGKPVWEGFPFIED